MSADMQQAMIVRVEALGDFAATVEAMVHQLGYGLPVDASSTSERDHGGGSKYQDEG